MFEGSIRSNIQLMFRLNDFCEDTNSEASFTSYHEAYTILQLLLSSMEVPMCLDSNQGKMFLFSAQFSKEFHPLSRYRSVTYNMIQIYVIQ